MLCPDEENTNMPSLAKEYVESLTLEYGESLTLNCPECGGYKKFSVSNLDGTLVYNCYRNSCKVKGAIKTPHILQRMANDIVDRMVEDFVLPEYITKDISNASMKRFINRWELQNVALYYDVKDRRAVFPIYEKSRMVGAIGRSLHDNFPKWLRYDKSANYYHYRIGEDISVGVVVEDVISATVLATEIPKVTGIAILGTSLNDKHKDYLKGFKTIVVALDPDAASKTVAYTKELKSYCSNSNVVACRIEDDLKYKRENDIKKLQGIVHGTD